MVIKHQRLSRFLFHCVFYCTTIALVYFFLLQAHSGKRGLDAKIALDNQIKTLQKELHELKEEHAEWDRRIALLKPEQMDQDLLEERARLSLGYVNKNDVVIMLNQP